MRRRRRLLAVLAVLGATVTLLAGCSGVPTSSTPQVVGSVDLVGGGEPQPIQTPAAGIQPHTLVQNFLAVNAVGTAKHASARSYLTAAAGSRWTDSTVTVVSALSVGTYVPGRPIVVNADEVGTVSASGVYTPTLQTNRSAAVQFSFGIGMEKGEYRISSLRSGLILTESQFQSGFLPRSVYFFDLAHTFLVPDARWIADTDQTTEAEALMNLLAAGPSEGLQNAVSTDTLPAQSSTRHVDVSGTDPLRIEIAGSSQLDATSRNRLAAQVAQTLSNAGGRSREITDGGRPVMIPQASGTLFDQSDFASTLAGPPVGSAVYYVRGGQIVDESRQLIPGPLNAGRYPLTSLAVSRSGAGGVLSVAGVSGPAATFVMGDESVGLRESKLTGVTSRPAFAPGRVEAWVGAGPAIYRCTLAGTKIATTAVQLPSSVVGQTVLALRLSVEGSRIAVVLKDSSGRQQLYTGAVVRTATQVRVDSLAQISPDGVVVTDVAWVDDQRLYATGYDVPGDDAHIYQTGADGSAWSEDGLGELPGPPSTITAAVGSPAWVGVTNGSSGKASVFFQVNSTMWRSPGAADSFALGNAPTYLE